MTPNPTTRDLRILDYMKAGNTISSMQLFKMMKTTGGRDAIFRLRKAGHDIKSEIVILPNRKRYAKYWVGEEGE